MPRPDPLAGTPYFAFARRPFREEHLASYVRREHAKGRHLTEILADPVIGRLGSAEFAWQVLLRPETLATLGHDVAEALGACTSELSPSPGSLDGTVQTGASRSQLPASDHRPRILAADDEASFRGLYRRWLDRAGYDLTLSADGAEAVEAVVRDGPPDAVVLDATMPRLDGISACRTIRQDNPRLPILIVTSREPDTVRSQAEAAGANAVLTKSSCPQSLLDFLAASAHAQAIPSAPISAGCAEGRGREQPHRAPLREDPSFACCDHSSLLQASIDR